MSHMAGRPAGRKRRSSTFADQQMRSQSPDTFEDDLEQILPSGVAAPPGGDEPASPSPEPAPEQARTNRFKRVATEQTIAVKLDTASRVKAAVRMSTGGRRRKTRRGAATGSIFAAMEHEANNRRCSAFWKVWMYAFNPNARFKMTWDAAILVLVVYSCFAVPYHTAFTLEELLRSDPSNLGMSTSDWIVDAIFYVDIVLNFWTGYDTGYMIDTRKGKIAMHYLTSRFPVDVIATVEWDLIIRLAVCGSGGCVGSLRHVNDYTSLTRMLKVLRLARAGPLMANLTSHMTVHSAYVDAGMFFLYVIVVAHVLACFFYMIPILFSCDDTHEQIEGVWNMNYTCMPTSWRTNYELNDANNQALMPKDSQYLSALYWSLTTMTTIGYGDRGPGNDPEIKFTLCAEIVGLCFFVLLLQEITSVYEESRRQVTEKNAVKDEIIQFLKRAVPSSNSEESDVKEELIDKIVAFLQFKGNSSSSREFDVDLSPNFAELSEALQEEIKVAVFRPMLMEVRMFGRCSADKEDELKVEEMFKEADTDNSNEISEAEVRTLIRDHFHVDLSDDELAHATSQMDSGKPTPWKKQQTQDEEASSKKATRNGEEVQIELEEFQQWWYMQKHGRPKIGPCPSEMLERFSLRLRSECASPCDRIVRKGEYGDRLFILNGGRVEICDHGLSPTEEQMNKENENDAFEYVPSSDGRILRRIAFESSHDKVFGLLAVLNEPGETVPEFEAIRWQMRQVAVYAGSHEHDYTEVLYFTQEDVIAAFKHNYHDHFWDVGDFDTPLEYWQECARNLYGRLYWDAEHEQDEPYEWGKYREGLVSPQAGADGEQQRQLKAAAAAAAAASGSRDAPPPPADRKRNKKGSSSGGGGGGGGGAQTGGLQRVESRQEAMIKEQMVIEKKVGLLDMKVDDIARRQQTMMDKMDAILDSMSMKKR